MIALEPCGFDANDRISGGVGLVEGIGRKSSHLVINLRGNFLRNAIADAAGYVNGAVFIELAVDEVFALLRHDLVLFLRHRTADKVASTVAVASQITDNLHDLLLIDHATVGDLENRPQLFCFIVDAVGILLALNVAWNGLHRPRTVE